MDTTKIEEWRPVTFTEFAALYEVSSLGRVRSRDRICYGKNREVRRWPGKVLKPNINTTGYGQVVLNADPIPRRTVLVHRLIALAFIPNPDDLPEINHIDGDKINNTISNLEWVTKSRNVIHAIGMGLIKPVGPTKLSDVDLDEIKRLYVGGSLTQQDIAELFGVARSLISRIVNGKHRAR